MITVLPKCISTKQLPFLPGEGSPGKAGNACGGQPAPLGSSAADAQEGSRDGVRPSASEVRAAGTTAQEGERETLPLQVVPIASPHHPAFIFIICIYYFFFSKIKI